MVYSEEKKWRKGERERERSKRNIKIELRLNGKIKRKSTCTRYCFRVQENKLLKQQRDPALLKHTEKGGQVGNWIYWTNTTLSQKGIKCYYMERGLEVYCNIYIHTYI